MSARAFIAHGEDLDELEAIPTTTVKGGRLRPGMVLVDPDFKTPAAEVDHRVGARGGTVRYLILDYDARRYETVGFHENAAIEVMAR